jgi:redox-sensitive bicupin YhaK (pirin superfamily)
MSGPVTAADVPLVGAGSGQHAPTVEVTESRASQVGSLTVRRALPRRDRRTVGAWCFADHAGPVTVTEESGFDIGPHPHMGLQTVTWLLAGEMLHRDSLGSEQLIRPGQLNLMTAGHGVSHAEERTGGYRGDLHAVQLWVAQPEATRHDAPGFEHHAELPVLDVDGGTATVFVGALGGAISPARRDTDHLGAEVVMRAGGTTVPLERRWEHALVPIDGTASVDGTPFEPGHLVYLGSGRDEVRISTTEGATALLIGGAPFEEPVLMWWNFVARTRAEVDQARDDWMAGDDRFGDVASHLARIPVGPPPWSASQEPPR